MNPSTTPSWGPCPKCGNTFLIAVYAHRLCDSCGWHSPGFEHVVFPWEEASNGLLLNVLADFSDIPRARARRVVEQEIRATVEAWRSHWPDKEQSQAANPRVSEPAEKPAEPAPSSDLSDLSAQTPESSEERDIDSVIDEEFDTPETRAIAKALRKGSRGPTAVAKDLDGDHIKPPSGYDSWDHYRKQNSHAWAEKIRRVKDRMIKLHLLTQ